jgi:hypothetical protein
MIAARRVKGIGADAGADLVTSYKASPSATET